MIPPPEEVVDLCSAEVATELASLEFSSQDYYEGCVAAVRTPSLQKALC